MSCPGHTYSGHTCLGRSCPGHTCLGLTCPPGYFISSRMDAQTAPKADTMVGLAQVKGPHPETPNSICLLCTCAGGSDHVTCHQDTLRKEAPSGGTLWPLPAHALGPGHFLGWRRRRRGGGGSGQQWRERGTNGPVSAGSVPLQWRLHFLRFPWAGEALQGPGAWTIALARQVP